MGKNTLVLGIDGMESSLIYKWTEQGELPNFKHIMKQGIYGEVEISSSVSAAQWITHFIGISEQIHGIKGFRIEKGKIVKGSIGNKGETGEARLINTGDIPYKTYPEFLDEQGYRVGLINPMPFYPPLKLKNGFCISGLLTPPDEREFTYPKELKNDLINYEIDVLYGNRPYGFIDDELNTSLETLRDDILRVEKSKIINAKELINDDIDLLYILFKSMDVIQHVFWGHIGDEESPYKNEILNYYKLIDDFIGYILENYPHWNIIALSDHGFQDRLELTGSGHFLQKSINRFYPLFPSPIRNSIKSRFKKFYVNFWKKWRNSSLTSSSKDKIMTGGHSNQAFWLMKGEGVKEGKRIDTKFEDITPTILYLTGSNIPKGLEGDFVAEAFDNPSPTYTETKLKVNRERPEEEILERLVNLGYADFVEGENDNS